MLGAQAEGVQAEVFGNPTFSLRSEHLQSIYLSSDFPTDKRVNLMMDTTENPQEAVVCLPQW